MQDKMLDAAIAAVYEETAAMMKRGFSDLSIQVDAMQACSDTVAKILKLKSQSQAEGKIS